MNSTQNTFTADLMQFLDRSPVALLAADNICRLLAENHYQQLQEGDSWELQPGGRYCVTRNGSAVIAFRIPANTEAAVSGFHIVASHLDSPTFRVKSNAEIVIENQYVTLNVEKYGGMILSTWLDRPLSVAGRVLVRTGAGIESRLLNIDQDLMIIPSVAIHMNRQVNDGYKWDMKQDLRPLLAGMNDSHSFHSLIARGLGISPEDIIDTDLFLYNRQKASVTGLNGEFLSSGRLDDLQCAYSSLIGFLGSEQGSSFCSADSQSARSGVSYAPSGESSAPEAPTCATIPVYCALDNEEVGSMTKQGADSSFLRDTLERISEALGRSHEDLRRSIASSFMISADNAHAVHPNHPELEDPTHRPVLNGGIVIKYSANQKYTTDAVSGAIMQELCRIADVPCQLFYNRSDLLGGSTLGNISGTQLSLNTVDIGLPQLAMHSAYETAGVCDGEYLARVCRVFYSGSLSGNGDGSYQLRFPTI